MRKLVAPAMAIAVVGAATVGLIKESEGLRNNAYQDAVGVWTICYGHTGPEVRKGLRYSDAKCDEVLTSDIMSHLTRLKVCVKVPLSRNRLGAILDLSFNVGTEAVCKSTLLRKANAGDWAGAYAEFPKWDKARVGGKLVSLPGLRTRRAREQALWATPLPENETTPLASLKSGIQSLY